MSVASRPRERGDLYRGVRQVKHEWQTSCVTISAGGYGSRIALRLSGTTSINQTQLRLPATFRARICTIMPLIKTEGAGNAGRLARPQPRMQIKKAYERSHHRSAATIRH